MASLSQDKPLVLRDTLTLTSNGTFLKASYPYARKFLVRVIGGGGGSGDANGSNGIRGAGGGGGGYTEKWYTQQTMPASVAYTIGTGGAAKTAGTSSTFDVMSSGGGEGASAVDNIGTPGRGGSATGGDRNYGGFDGQRGGQTDSQGSGMGCGGGTWYTGPTLAPFGQTTGPGGVLGAGAAGAYVTQVTATERAGGTGGNGVIYIEIYA